MLVRTVGKATRPWATSDDTSFPKALADWIARDGTLLESLLALRRLGAEGRDALEAVLAVRRVAALRASWGLWEAITEGDGDDPEVLLIGVLPLTVVEHARRALWGSSWRDADEAQPDQAPRTRLAPVTSR
jgi:hypothetical protein